MMGRNMLNLTSQNTLTSSVVKKVNILTFKHLKTRRTIALRKPSAFQTGTDTETAGRREKPWKRSVWSANGGLHR